MLEQGTYFKLIFTLSIDVFVELNTFYESIVYKRNNLTKWYLTTTNRMGVRMWRGHIFFKRPRHKISLLQTHRAACRPSRHLEPRHLTSRRQTGHPKTLPLHLPLPRPLEAHRRARHERITFNRHAWVPRQSEPADIGLAPADLTPVMVSLRLITAQTGTGGHYQGGVRWRAVDDIASMWEKQTVLPHRLRHAGHSHCPHRKQDTEPTLPSGSFDSCKRMDRTKI